MSTNTVDPSNCPQFSFCFRPEDCWDGEEETSSCFMLVLLELVGGAILIAFAEVIPRFFPKVQTQIRNRIRGKDEGTEEAFLQTERTEENFIRANTDPDVVMPCPGGIEYDTNLTPGTIRSFFPLSGKIGSFVSLFDASLISPIIIMGSFGLAMVSSAISSLLYLGLKYEDYCPNHHLDIYDVDFKDWIGQVGGAFSEIASNYKFYPVFLLVGYIAFVVARWREYMICSHVIQARLHDSALLIGAAMRSPVSMKDRQRLYTIYRLLNLVHALCYHAVSPSLRDLDPREAYIEKLGLMTNEEAEILLPLGDKMRDGAIALLINKTMEMMGSDEIDRQFVEVQLSHVLYQVRAYTAEFHDLFVRDNPNSYLDVLLTVENSWVFLICLGYPFSLFVETPIYFLIPCFQPLVFLGVFTIASITRVSYSLILRLRNPFSTPRDMIKVDAFLAGTDRTLFTDLRIAFRSTPQNKEGTPTAERDPGNGLVDDLATELKTDGSVVPTRGLRRSFGVRNLGDSSCYVTPDHLSALF